MSESNVLLRSEMYYRNINLGKRVDELWHVAQSWGFQACANLQRAQRMAIGTSRVQPPG